VDGEIDFELVQNQLSDLINVVIDVNSSGADTWKYGVTLFLDSEHYAMFRISNLFELERNSEGNLIIPESAYSVEQGRNLDYLYIKELNVSRIQVIYDFNGNDLTKYDSDKPGRFQELVLDYDTIVIPLDAQREIREFGLTGKVVLTYENGEVVEFDLDTGNRLGDDPVKPTSNGEVEETETYTLSIQKAVAVDGLLVTIEGNPDSSVIIECSSDLKTWTLIGTVPLDGYGFGYHNDDPASRGEVKCFYRVSPYDSEAATLVEEGITVLRVD
jgi:hypothetical protein